MQKPYLITFLALIVVPCLSVVIICAIPFAFLYLICELFKKPAIVEKKQSNNFFDFALKTYKKNGIQNK